MGKVLGHRAMAVMDYLFLLGIIVGTFSLFSKPFYKIYQNYVAGTASRYFGPQVQSRMTPFVSKGSRHLADQTAVYGLDGVTSAQNDKTLRQNVNQDGSRSLVIGKKEREYSPGSGELGSKPEYALDDAQNEPPEYIPPFVNAAEGWVEPSVNN